MAPIKVLLVDDEMALLQALSQRLEARGFQVAVAHSGEKALAILEGAEPDVVVLDLKMPGIDGLGVLRSTRQICPGIQVIILTGQGSPRDRDTAMRLGAFDYLQKPVDIGVLVSVLRRAAGLCPD
ncbi:MAG: response regulator [Syntrophobacteraceae bacterium]|nr:response regulator [Syntrophobacteraceae bacterium]